MEGLGNHELKFNNILIPLLKQLINLTKADISTDELSELNRKIKKYSKRYQTMRDGDGMLNFVEEAVKLIAPFIGEVVSKNEQIFSKDSEHENVYLLKKIDFKKIWPLIEDDAVKDDIWEHIKCLYVVGNYALKKHRQFQMFVKGNDEIIKQILLSSQIDKEIRETLNIEEEEEAKDQEFDWSMFGDNLIIKVFREINEELDLPKLDSDERGLLMSAIQSNMADMRGLQRKFQGLSGKFNTKMEGNKDIDEMDAITIFYDLLTEEFGVDVPKLREIFICVVSKIKEKIKEKDIDQSKVKEAINELKNTLIKKLAKKAGMSGSNIEQLINKFLGDGPGGILSEESQDELIDQFSNKLQNIVNSLDNPDDVEEFQQKIVDHFGLDAEEGK